MLSHVQNQCSGMIAIDVYYLTIYAYNIPDLCRLNPELAAYFYVLHSSLIFIQITNRIPVISLFLHAEWKTVWIQISWLHRSQLIWIYTVFKIRMYPCLALLGLIFVLLNHDLSFFKNIVDPDQLASDEAI